MAYQCTSQFQKFRFIFGNNLYLLLQSSWWGAIVHIVHLVALSCSGGSNGSISSLYPLLENYLVCSFRDLSVCEIGEVPP